MNPFEIVDNINEKKGYLEADQLDDYVPFVVNKALSFQKDNIFYANEMNMASKLEPDQAYNFYYHAIPKKKRWAKWEKLKVTDDIKNLMTFFECSYRKAFEYNRVLTPAQKAEIKEKLNKAA